MGGFAKGGVIVHRTDNLAVQGAMPLGLAAVGNTFWREDRGAAQAWQFLATTKARGMIGSATFTTPSINTTGANLIVAMVVGTNTSYGFTDSANNAWSLGPTNSSSFWIYYVLNPTTSTSHTFTLSNIQAGSMVVAAFKGPTDVFVDQVPAYVTNGTLIPSITANPLTPTANNSLIVSYCGGNQSGTAIDSGFTLIDTWPYLTAQSLASAQAYLTQTAVATVAPTWTLDTSTPYGGVIAGSMSFISKPTQLWELLSWGVYNGNTGPIVMDTIGATLLVHMSSSSNNLQTWTETPINTWAYVGGTSSNYPAVQSAYVYNPITSSTYTISSVTGLGPQAVVMAFKYNGSGTPSSYQWSQLSSSISSNIIQAPGIALTTPSLIVMSGALGDVSQIASIDSNMTFIFNDPGITNVTYPQCVAWGIAGGSVSPTITYPAASANRRAILASFM